jgi:hypothetical protein
LSEQDPEILLFDLAERRPEACDSQGGSRLAPSRGMTSSTTKDHPPDAKSDAAIEPPTARKTQSGLAAPRATSQGDLELRIRRHRAELIGKLGELRADTRLAATQTRDRVKARLSELAHIVKIGVVDGWTDLGDAVKHKLERWLAESQRSLSTQDVPAKNGQS